MKEDVAAAAKVCITWIDFQVWGNAVRVDDHLEHVGELVGLVVRRRRLFRLHSV